MTFPHQDVYEGEFIACTEGGQRKRRKFLLPSNFLITQCATKLENHTKQLGLGYVVNNALGHKRLKFNYNQLLKFILKMHSLDKIAENSKVEIYAILDGAKFTNHIAHVTCRIKVINIRAIDSKINDLLLNFQSRELSFIF